jgi:hypothetical protein
VYNWADTLTNLSQEYGIDASEFAAPSFFSSGRFFSIKISDQDPELTPNRLFAVSVNSSDSISPTVYGIAPIKIIGRYAILSKEHFDMMVSGGFLSIAWGSSYAYLNNPPAAVGYVFPMYDSTKITSAESITSNIGYANAGKFYTDTPLPKGAQVFLHGVGSGMVIDTDGKTYFSVQFRYIAGMTIFDFSQYSSDYYFRYSLDAYTRNHWSAVSPDYATIMSAPALVYDNYPVSQSSAYAGLGETKWAYGTGVDVGDVQTVDSYLDYLTLKNNLSCMVNGYIFNLDEDTPPTFTGYSAGSSIAYANPVLPPPKMASTQVITKANGQFSLPFTNAYYYYQEGDKISYRKFNTDGEVTSIYLFTVVSASSTHLVLAPDDSNTSTSITFTINCILHYTRTSRYVPVDIVNVYDKGFFGKSYPGDTVFFGGYGEAYPSHELLWEHSAITVVAGVYTVPGLVFKNPVTFGSEITLYISARWTSISWGAEKFYSPYITNYWSGLEEPHTVSPAYGILSSPKDSDLINSVPFSGATWYCSKSDGVYRFNGTEVYSLKLVRPQVETVRSVPGSKGTFPVTAGANNELIGQPVACLFVYSFLDSTNQKVESEVSSQAEGFFTPNASSDGSNYAELVEFKITGCPSLVQIPKDISLDVYVQVTPVGKPTLDWVFYKSVPVTPGIPTVVTVGDISPETLLESTLRIYSLGSQSHTPCLYGKYLVSLDNRLVMMNCRTWEYAKIRASKVFRADNYFGAYLNFVVPADTPKIGGSPWSCTADSSTNVVTIPGYTVVTGTYGIFSGTSLPSPLSYSSTYWLVKTGASTAKLAATYSDAMNGVTIDLISSGSSVTFKELGVTGDIGFFTTPLGVISALPAAKTVASINTTTNEITITGHGLVTGQSGTFSATTTLPDPIVSGTRYYVSRVSADVIKLHGTYADAVAGTNVVDITTTGTGTITFQLPGILTPAQSTDSDISSYYPSTVSATDPYPATSTYTLDYTTSTTSAFTSIVSGVPKSLSAEFYDPSFFFKINLGSAFFFSSFTDRHKIKLRTVGDIDLSGQSIDLVRDKFGFSSIDTNYSTLYASTPWTDTSFTVEGTPTSLVGVSIRAYLNAQPTDPATFWDNISKEAVKNRDAFLTVAGGTDGKATVTLLYKDSVYPSLNYVFGYPPVIISGPGTFGGLKWSPSGKILDFDSDLEWYYSEYGDSTTTYSDPATGTLTKYKQIVLKAVREVNGVSTYPDLYTTPGTLVTEDEYDMEFFTDISGNLTGNSVTGFSTRATTMTIRIPTAATSVFSSTSAGEYVTFVLSDNDASNLPPSFPDIRSGSFRVLSRITDGSDYEVVVEIPPNKYPRKLTSNVTMTFSPDSYCVNLNKLFIGTSTGFQLPLRSRSGVTFSPATLAADKKVFVCVRGVDFSSANLSLSGWFNTETSTATNFSNLRVGYDITTTMSIDYSRISGIKYTSVLVSDTKYPIPAPLKLGAAESLVDLALPLFSKDPLLTALGLTQVTRRMMSCVNSTELSRFMHAVSGAMWGDPDSPSSAAYIPCEANEIVLLLTNRDTNKYFLSPRPKLDEQDFRVSCPGPVSSFPYYSITRYSPTLNTIGVVDVGGIFGENCDFFSNDLPNTVVWTSTQRETGGTRVTQFEVAYRKDLGSDDDSEIIGGTVFQNTLIISKKNSLWRGSFDDSGDLILQRIQSPVGAYGHNNIPAALSNFYFIHPTGVYVSDGNSVDPIFKLNSLFTNNVDVDARKLSRTSGYVDHTMKQIYVGTPYRSSFVENVAEVDGQFNYSYTDGVFGWQVNVGLDAYKWASRSNKFYFASSRGRVFKIRNEQALTRYRDGEDAIGMAVATRFAADGDIARFKFLRNVLFQIAGTSNFQLNAYYSTNYDTTLTPMETYPISGEVLANGAKWYGNQKLLRSLRETLAKRVQSISFTLTEGSIDSDCPIYMVAIEGFQTNTRLVRQKSTPGERT